MATTINYQANPDGSITATQTTVISKTIPAAQVEAFLATNQAQVDGLQAQVNSLSTAATQAISNVKSLQEAKPVEASPQ